jgi:hypothetical protein
MAFKISFQFEDTALIVKEQKQIACHNRGRQGYLFFKTPSIRRRSLPIAGSLRSDKRALNSRWEDVDSEDGSIETLRY